MISKGKDRRKHVVADGCHGNTSMILCFRIFELSLSLWPKIRVNHTQLVGIRHLWSTKRSQIKECKKNALKDFVYGWPTSIRSHEELYSRGPASSQVITLVSLQSRINLSPFTKDFRGGEHWRSLLRNFLCLAFKQGDVTKAKKDQIGFCRMPGWKG